MRSNGVEIMTSYLAILANGESVDAVRIGTHFESLTGELLDPVSLINFDQITHDQYAFEQVHKSFTLKGDYSKDESLKYRNSWMEGSYRTWRVASGLPAVDPEYKSLGVMVQLPESPIYPNFRRRRGD